MVQRGHAEDAFAVSQLIAAHLQDDAERLENVMRKIRFSEGLVFTHIFAFCIH